MRITDLSVPTPVIGSRPPSSRRAGADTAPNIVASAAREPGHPDEVAAVALARAASHAQAARIVAAANQAASASVRGDGLSTELVP